jgi:hypothetical protein
MVAIAKSLHPELHGGQGTDIDPVDLLKLAESAHTGVGGVGMPHSYESGVDTPPWGRIREHAIVGCFFRQHWFV